ncbi:MAG: putative porin [Actinobacteria bacterium]|nr:putative porin [Actinomycetota bacterium]
MNWTFRPLRTAALCTLLAAALGTPAAAEETKKEDPTLTDIVNILHEKGLIDDEQHAALAAKAAKEQTKRSWTDRLSVYGDLRGRFEWFDYDQDIYTKSAGGRLQDRERGRYRARLGVTADVVSRAAVTIALASGGADPRSANQTLGSGNDFDKDEFRLDLAYATLAPFPKGELPGIENGYLGVDIGKVKNPFVWKLLPADNLLFDNDINPEGGNLRITGGAGPVLLFANGGVYVIDENSAAKDPKVAGGQLGGSVELADWASLGARGTLYHFFSLDDDFFARSASNPGGPGGTGGNIIDGLARRNGSLQIAEGSAFVTVVPHVLVPVTFYGTFATNFSARNSLIATAVDREADAWTAGVFAGDPVRLIRIGFAYYYVEANAFPSLFLESDVLDGTPNRKGYMLSFQRALFPNVDLGVRGFWSDRIEGGTAFANSGPASDRFRGQADLMFKF